MYLQIKLLMKPSEYEYEQTFYDCHYLNYLFHILGVYELVTFLMKPGGPALWGEAFERAVNAHVNQGYAKLIGVFHSEYGILNRGTDVHFFSNFYVY